MASWQAEATDAGTTLAAFVKARAGVAWSVAKRHVESGKAFVDGAAITDVAHRLRGGEAVELRANAQRPRDPMREGELVFDDAHVVVIDKPAGISSVPYDDRELGTAMDLVRGAWRRMGKPATTVPLHVVHRIDRATSGLLAFAKTKRAEAGMQAQLRAHEMQRTYVCVAHGEVTSRRIESHLVEDRGDGLRGSTSRLEQGKRAVTHVTARELLYGRDLRPTRGDGAGANDGDGHARIVRREAGADDGDGHVRIAPREAGVNTDDGHARIAHRAAGVDTDDGHARIAPREAGADAGPARIAPREAGADAGHARIAHREAGADAGDRHARARDDRGERAEGLHRIAGRTAIATRCEVQLETGKTHQIRIHMSEAGHPLVGEPVYIRDYTGSLLTSGRMMLHAATLGFEHPVTGQHVQLSSPLPPDFIAVLDRLRGYA